MDPTALIVGALAAGAQNVATEAVRDAYAGLRALVRRRLSRQPAGQVALDRYETRPDRWKEVLSGELVESRADRDPEVIEAARQLMALVDARGSARGRYDIDMRGAQGVQFGDHSTQTNTFGPPPRY